MHSNKSMSDRSDSLDFDEEKEYDAEKWAEIQAAPSGGTRKDRNQRYRYVKKLEKEAEGPA